MKYLIVSDEFIFPLSSQNTASFRVCSGLLSAVTDYQYTLRSWKKDVYELFLDNDFFKLDLLSLQYWRSIIDRLMTYDNATFKDLMTRINLTQSGAINIFANREQEMEQRASLLKRLTFVIFCGEVDQYHSYMPDIQERLVDSLRQMQVRQSEAYFIGTTLFSHSIKEPRTVVIFCSLIYRSD